MEANRQPLDQVDHSPGGMMVPMSQSALEALLQEAGMMAPQQQTYFPQPIQQQAPRRDWVLISGMATAGAVLLGGMGMLTLAIASPNAQVQRANENTALIAVEALERPTVNCVALFIPKGACTAADPNAQPKRSSVVQPQPMQQEAPVIQPVVAVGSDAPLPAEPPPIANTYMGWGEAELVNEWNNVACQSGADSQRCADIAAAYNAVKGVQ